MFCLAKFLLIFWLRPLRTSPALFLVQIILKEIMLVNEDASEIFSSKFCRRQSDNKLFIDHSQKTIKREFKA
ncbi:hypothetical protein BpHYR1_031851 [Brachionus plicatilis]|uniref:Uncharacterized protein n=1 Tax=Brachionus plicatilis TaxID=10195 RepID=A0A3M7PS31_BRAPC|nr:hypothetical protein BpHYR1_031851 [Brachionus plicatilis]